MIKETVTYEDYNGVTRTDECWFNLNEAELVKMQLSQTGGFDTIIRKILNEQDMPSLMKVFEDLILRSYGEKSADGKRFIKVNEAGVPLSVGFSQSEAYSKIFMKLTTDTEAAARFVNGIMPAKIAEELQKREAAGIAEFPTIN